MTEYDPEEAVTVDPALLRRAAAELFNRTRGGMLESGELSAASTDVKFAEAALSMDNEISKGAKLAIAAHIKRELQKRKKVDKVEAKWKAKADREAKRQAL